MRRIPMAAAARAPRMHPVRAIRPMASANAEARRRTTVLERGGR